MSPAAPNTASRAVAIGCRAARWTAWVAAVVAVVLCGVLLVLGAERTVKHPLDSTDFLKLKAELAKDDHAEVLREQIRQEDWRLRRHYFRRQRSMHLGAHLLLLDVIILAGAAKTASVLGRRLPSPAPAEPSTDDRPQRAAARRARWSVAALAVVVVGLAGVAVNGVHTRLTAAIPSRDREGAGASPTASPLPHGRGSDSGGRGSDSGGRGSDSGGRGSDSGARGSDSRETPTGPGPATAATAPAPDADVPNDKEIAANWPRFRGPDGSGIAVYTNLPTAWDAAAGKNLLWKTPVPLPGNNSPIVWGDRVFLSGANARKREVYCFDAATGKLLWTLDVPATPQSRNRTPRVEADTGFAAPTMTTDGRRVYAIFANGDVVAVDFAGRQVWIRGLGIPNNTYGHASSLAMYRDRLLIQFDQGSPDDKLSKMIALAAATGEPLWQIPRPVANSWGTPAVVRAAGRDQLVTAADPWVIAYDPADGKELWRVEGIMGDQGVSPVVVGDLVQVGNEYCEWFAIRADGNGNVTETKIEWRGEDGLPDTVSPLVVGDLLLLTTSSGLMTCYGATDGEVLWEEDFEADITSSPTLVGRNVFLFGKDGKGWIIEPSREKCQRVGETDLGEPCVTSPAVQDGRFYIRGEKHLFCIGNRE